MRRKQLSLNIVLIALVALVAPAWGLDANETDAKKVMTAVNDQPDGDRIKARMVMVVRDSQGREKKRIVQSKGLDFKDGTKQLLLFEKPADVRNIGLLSIDYDDGNKDDDQWLYLPSLRKSTRISSSDKSGSFMGTDLTYSDMTEQDPDTYDYKMLDAAATVGGEACWKIEARPNTDKVRKETGYVKSVMWISKEKLMPLQVKNWVRDGKKLKFIKFKDIKKVDGIWVAHKILAQTKRGKQVESKTLIAYKSFKINQADVKASDFNQRQLEKGL